MSLNDMLFNGGGILIVVFTLVQISPIHINPWSWIARVIGGAINKELSNKLDQLEKKVDSIDNKVDDIEKKNEEESIILCRARMLRFGDEILHGTKHSKDHFDQILLDCTSYTNYCAEHPGFINHITQHTVDLINHTYDECLEKKSFL